MSGVVPAVLGVKSTKALDAKFVKNLREAVTNIDDPVDERHNKFGAHQIVEHLAGDGRGDPALQGRVFTSGDLANRRQDWGV